VSWPLAAAGRSCVTSVDRADAGVGWVGARMLIPAGTPAGSESPPARRWRRRVRTRAAQPSR